MVKQFGNQQNRVWILDRDALETTINQCMSHITPFSLRRKGQLPLEKWAFEYAPGLRIRNVLPYGLIPCNRERINPATRRNGTSLQVYKTTVQMTGRRH